MGKTPVAFFIKKEYTKRKQSSLIMKHLLKINEIFGPTIQGEGKSAGKEVSFVRTSMCNLQCIWCDTPYTWNWIGTLYQHNDSKKYSPAEEIHLMDIETIVSKVEQIGIKAVVISGGEPLIQYKRMVPLLQRLKELNYWIEVETNGTIFPKGDFMELVDQINCSPKLSNSGNGRIQREHGACLTSLALSPKVNFKFVVASRGDIGEILYLVNQYKMKEVYLMPLGINKEELAKTIELTQRLCAQHKFHFSDRIHITQLGGGRGV